MIKNIPPSLRDRFRKQRGSFSTPHHYQLTSRGSQAAHHYRGVVTMYTGPTRPQPPIHTVTHYPSRFTNLNMGISHTHGLQHSAVPLGPGGAGGEKRRGELPHLPLTSFSPLPPPPTRVGRGNPPQSGSKVCGSGLRDCWLSPS